MLIEGSGRSRSIGIPGRRNGRFCNSTSTARTWWGTPTAEPAHCDWRWNTSYRVDRMVPTVPAGSGTTRACRRRGRSELVRLLRRWRTVARQARDVHPRISSCTTGGVPARYASPMLTNSSIDPKVSGWPLRRPSGASPGDLWRMDFTRDIRLAHLWYSDARGRGKRLTRSTGQKAASVWPNTTPNRPWSNAGHWAQWERADFFNDVTRGIPRRTTCSGGLMKGRPRHRDRQVRRLGVYSAKTPSACTATNSPVSTCVSASTTISGPCPAATRPRRGRRRHWSAPRRPRNVRRDQSTGSPQRGRVAVVEGTDEEATLPGVERLRPAEQGVMAQVTRPPPETNDCTRTSPTRLRHWAHRARAMWRSPRPNCLAAPLLRVRSSMLGCSDSSTRRSLAKLQDLLPQGQRARSMGRGRRGAERSLHRPDPHPRAAPQHPGRPTRRHGRLVLMRSRRALGFDMARWHRAAWNDRELSYYAVTPSGFDGRSVWNPDRRGRNAHGS